MEWLACSPDLTQPDIFCGRCLKDSVYCQKISLEHLKQVIIQECETIAADMWHKTCQNVSIGIQACLTTEGGSVDHEMESRFN